MLVRIVHCVQGMVRNRVHNHPGGLGPMSLAIMPLLNSPAEVKGLESVLIQRQHQVSIVESSYRIEQLVNV